MKGLAIKVVGGEDKKQGKEAMMAADIVAHMMADRTYTHMAHLKTGSYAKHVALDEFYTSIVDFTDSFAEAAQGKFGRLDIPVGNVHTDFTDVASTLEGCIEDILGKSKACSNRSLNAILDEIETLYLTTIYKLRELH